MKINDYYERRLTPQEIADGHHRNFVGGLWHEIGNLQLQFLIAHGLRPDHRLVDVGCGALRCGVPIVRYLDHGNYYGLDINESLIEAGIRELENEGLTNKRAYLLVNDNFEMHRFETSFDFAIAQSVLTHLDMNLIIRCFVEVRRVLKREAKFFATFFQAPTPGHISPIKHDPGEVVTNFDRDPFHYSFAEMEWLAGTAGLSANLIGDWNHPRSQKMLELSIK
jgi:cyclopropane fatty-acyl-phospholipid synthase-like methyltransferase